MTDYSVGRIIGHLPSFSNEELKALEGAIYEVQQQRDDEDAWHYHVATFPNLFPDPNIWELLEEDIREIVFPRVLRVRMRRGKLVHAVARVSKFGHDDKFSIATPYGCRARTALVTSFIQGNPDDDVVMVGSQNEVTCRECNRAWGFLYGGPLLCLPGERSQLKAQIEAAKERYVNATAGTCYIAAYGSGLTACGDWLVNSSASITDEPESVTCESCLSAMSGDSNE